MDRRRFTVPFRRFTIVAGGAVIVYSLYGLPAAGLDARHLVLEITESVVMRNAEAACATLAQLRELGIRLSIDDFGTGYSSLSYLHRFPVNTLKIDRSFVGLMGEAGENSEIIRTIITLADNLGLEVVAEGVETEEQRGELRAMRCGFGQGYLFRRPADAEETERLLEQRGLCPPPPAAAPPDFVLDVAGESDAVS